MNANPKPRRMRAAPKDVLREQLALAADRLIAEQQAADSLRASLLTTQCTVLDLHETIETLRTPWWRRLWRP